MTQRSNPYAAGCLVVGSIVALIALIILGLSSFVGIDKGEVGVISNAGYVDKNQVPLGPGWHFKSPIGESVDNIAVVQQSHRFSEVTTAAQNQQTIYVDGTISYHVDSTKAAILDIQGGPDQLINRLLWPAFNDFIKEETPKYADYRDVLNNRPKIRENVTRVLQGKTDQYGLFVDDIFLTNIRPETSYTDAINNAAKAQQDLVTATNEAKAKVAAAQGDADSNRIKQQTITDQVLQQQKLNNEAAAIAKWKGDVPNTLVINGDSSNPVSLIFGATK
jgi:regulator of protease activity HflC (stomatin/prohibitin superfamily)